MSFKEAILRLCCDIGKTVHQDAINDITKCHILKNPSRDNHDDEYILRVLSFTSFYVAKQTYGYSETKIRYEVQLGHEEPLDYLPMNSSVYPINGSDEWMIYIGCKYDDWEQIFYEICHESVHLLNPAEHEDLPNVQRLDEGVAVKFAENMYKKYITPYTTKPPKFTPVRLARLSQYTKSFNITNKISDEKLKEVRSIFGSFWSIPDKEKFMSIVGNYITDKEADYLLSDFDYNRP